MTTQSELLAHEVYLTDRIDKYDTPSPWSGGLGSELTWRSSSRESLNHLSCVAFLSASDASIEAVKRELAKPKYGSYWLCMSFSTRFGKMPLTSRLFQYAQ